MTHVTGGGALAVQMPGNWDSAAHRLMRNVAAQFPATENVREWFTHDLGFYYDVLSPHAARVDLWATEYIHVMDGPADIVEWYKGTGMRPFLDALPSTQDRERFLAIVPGCHPRGLPRTRGRPRALPLPQNISVGVPVDRRQFSVAFSAWSIT